MRKDWPDDVNEFFAKDDLAFGNMLWIPAKLREDFLASAYRYARHDFWPETWQECDLPMDAQTISALGVGILKALDEVKYKPIFVEHYANVIQRDHKWLDKKTAEQLAIFVWTYRNHHHAQVLDVSDELIPQFYEDFDFDFVLIAHGLIEDKYPDDNPHWIYKLRHYLCKDNDEWLPEWETVQLGDYRYSKKYRDSIQPKLEGF